MLNWTKRFNIFCLLDNQEYTIQPQHYELVLGAGVKKEVYANSVAALSALEKQEGWYLGHLSYELHNQLAPMAPAKKDLNGFPQAYFFVPEVLLLVRGGQLQVIADDAASVYEEIMQQPEFEEQPQAPVAIQQRLSREEYLAAIAQLQKHIQAGDCYEINFCQEFFATGVKVHPLSIFSRLTALSPSPFSALYRCNDSWLVCASPERFLARQGSSLRSQPMKGTIRRDHNNSTKDEQLKTTLHQSSKDRSENVMVVDLVRNDLSRICKEASVKVEELFGVYTFPQVHQMISTVCGELKPDISFAEIMRACFPMGSMTGAPKHRVMQLIQQYETSARGIFSGSVGYISPQGDFDFNVVIRSIMYNAATGYLSYQAGSGITIYSNPEEEWEECLLKAEAIKKVLAGGPALT